MFPCKNIELEEKFTIKGANSNGFAIRVKSKRSQGWVCLQGFYYAVWFYIVEIDRLVKWDTAKKTLVKSAKTDSRNSRLMLFLKPIDFTFSVNIPNADCTIISSWD